MDFLNGKKTYISALAAFGIVVCQAVIDWCDTGHVDLNLLFEATLTLAVIFLRKGISKIKEG